jgi:hypothetical protein
LVKILVSSHSGNGGDINDASSFNILPLLLTVDTLPYVHKCSQELPRKSLAKNSGKRNNAGDARIA